ncbi:MAG TPA: putative selenate ABC transporter substrate-binding protein [Pyrinomonadaceae bacterium]
MRRPLPFSAEPLGPKIRTTLLLALLIPAALCLSCSGGDRTGRPSQTTLRLSMIPTTDPGKMLRESRPLVDYLQRETGAKVELTIPTNYAAVVEAVGSEQVDIAHFGGFTYVQASARYGVRPLAQRDRDQNFHSVFITQPGSPLNSLADLKGHTFAFGDVNSTSGHLMPEYFMRQSGVDAEVITKAVYTGGHDATALAVSNSKVDAGALDELVFERMTKEGKLAPDSVRVFYTTPAFFDYVWAARKGLDPKLADGFANALLKLDASKAEDKKVLDILSATKYVKASDADYEKLRQAARDAGLLK